MRRLRKLIRALTDRGGDEDFVLASIPSKRIYPGRCPLHRPDLARLDDEPLRQRLGSFSEADGLSAQRRWIVREAAAHCVGTIGGSTAERGSFMGPGSYAIFEAHRKNMDGGCHDVFDSFEDLSRPSAARAAHWRANDLAVSEADVRRRLAAFDFVECKKGRAPERFGEAAHEEFCFVLVGVDLAEPTKASLEFFFPRLRGGGWMLIDDCGFGTCLGGHEGGQEVRRRLGVRVADRAAGRWRRACEAVLTGAAGIDPAVPSAGAKRAACPRRRRRPFRRGR